MLQVFSGKKILITGHTGFKGSWLSLWLKQKGAKLYGISKDIPTQPSLFEALELEQGMEHIIMDIRDLSSFKKEVKRIAPDFIFHMAAQPIVSLSYSDPIETFTTNAIGTANVLEAIRDLDQKCVVIFITSDKCYENVEWVWGYKETDMLGGKDIYSGSKAAAEIIIHSYYHSFIKKMPHIKMASVRAGNVIGGGDWAADRIVPDCMKSWSQNDKVEIRNPGATRPWQHVLEPLSGYLNIAAELWNGGDFNGESYNFGPPSENNITVMELLEKLGKSWGFEKAEDTYTQTGELKFSEAGLLKLNCDKALFDFKWQPTLNITELIQYTGDWYYRYYNNAKDVRAFTMQQISDYEKKASVKKIAWSSDI
ncbi:CDP-glucose 4,6-dehydratase [Algoriphagus ratkowskyi]|uniref:CDP-glucose 4,6-dehydratase n=1 Tax=Algoriphagus ratkowskyi TaxID=57028 RepID=A0A2W7QRR3_9BACT|nr:CDP-glucose 4,6-dehydratase [Algoriphagus ratkowskyi]PZX51288.1 CDP-glucose 4,6-dehydratase [Algoriphagus ratkowskyi]TXD75922.1 CDP-glucose 4,6-dehydratase [Algoriphagus ratkowskyi]